mmetsp:Transcript_11460/g.44387  ORF Transcript_11460/g.44387 Transcript_11460/m.44387 type:complete len:248 (-) Transcript_11460:655-1398(-)
MMGWTTRKWVRLLLPVEKERPQSSQVCGRSLLCTDRSCRLRWPFSVKPRPQVSQRKGFTEACRAATCSRMVVARINPALHSGQRTLGLRSADSTTEPSVLRMPSTCRGYAAWYACLCWPPGRPMGCSPALPAAAAAAAMAPVSGAPADALAGWPLRSPSDAGAWALLPTVAAAAAAAMAAMDCWVVAGCVDAGGTVEVLGRASEAGSPVGRVPGSAGTVQEALPASPSEPTACGRDIGRATAPSVTP